MMTWLRKMVGLYRLLGGYCPVCNSSPPHPDCYVCFGSRDYGPRITQVERKAWRKRFVWNYQTEQCCMMEGCCENEH